MQFLACCVSLGISVHATHARTELRTLHFIQSRDFWRAGSAAAADFSCVRFESPVAFPWFVTSNLCDSINLLLFQSSRSRCLECTRPAHPSQRITDRRVADCRIKGSWKMNIIVRTYWVGLRSPRFQQEETILCCWSPFTARDSNKTVESAIIVSCNQ